MSRFRTITRKAAQIDESTAREMFEIFSRYYVDIEYSRFCADLAEKSQCIFLYTPRDRADTSPRGCVPGRIVGFTTLVRRRDPGFRGATYLFSGDTVLDRCAWGQRLLERAFFWAMLREKIRAPFAPVYWMLISKGFITYLMMVRNFPMSHPRFDRPMPEAMRLKMTDFYSQRFGADFSGKTGLIRFSQPHGAVRGRLAFPKGSMRDDPDVGFFLRSNPHFDRGDELACMAEVRWRDFARHFSTAFRRRRNGRKPAQSRTKRSSLDLSVQG